MEAILSQIKIGNSIEVVYHANSNDRVNDNGEFKSLKGKVLEVKDCAAGKQYIIETAKGFRSFTSAAKIRTLTVESEQLVKGYATA